MSDARSNGPTKTPAPWRISKTFIDAKLRSASRTTVRLTASCSARVRSAGSWSPGARLPSLIKARMRSPTRWARPSGRPKAWERVGIGLATWSLCHHASRESSGARARLFTQVAIREMAARARRRAVPVLSDPTSAEARPATRWPRPASWRSSPREVRSGRSRWKAGRPSCPT